MVILMFPLNSFQLNITLSQFQIHTPLRSNQLMMLKYIISWNYYIQNIMKIFLMLTSRCFNIDWWSPLLQNFIQYLLCCFIKMEEQIFQSKIAFHTFLCLSQPRPLWNCLMETRYMPKELGLLYVNFLTVWLYIQLEQFIVVQVALPTLYHQVPSNFLLVKKVTYGPLEHCDFFDPQGCSWRSPYPLRLFRSSSFHDI